MTYSLSRHKKSARTLVGFERLRPSIFEDINVPKSAHMIDASCRKVKLSFAEGGHGLILSIKPGLETDKPVTFFRR